MSDNILEVDLLAFESGDGERARAVVDGLMTSLETGFVYVKHDLSEDLIDSAYGMLEEFFTAEREVKEQFVAPGTHGQTGYTGLLVETAATAEAPVVEHLGETPAGHLSKVYVLAESRGTGLAEALVRDGVARLEALGFRHVWLGTNAQNARANAFYERLGFETIGARTFVVGGTRVEDDWVRLLSLG